MPDANASDPGFRPSQSRYRRHAALFVLVMGGFFTALIWNMGAPRLLGTLTKTAYSLLMDTVFYTMAITVLAGAAGRLLSEFGFTGLINLLFARLMMPLYGLPGIAMLGATATFLSDNMSIVPFTRDAEFMRSFASRQVPLLCNLGTSYGMGLFVITVLVSLGHGAEALVGAMAALLGSVVSVRLMATFISRQSGGDWAPDAKRSSNDAIESGTARHQPRTSEAQDKGFFERFLVALLDGGKYGVEIGLNMIPGVLVICTAVMMLTKGMPAGGYDGGAYQGIGLIPLIGDWCRPILEPLFGFSSSGAVALPITALGSVGAAMSLVQDGIKHHQLSGNEIAVFAAFGILWSGFLSTHVAILDLLGYRRFMTAAIWSHLIAGLVAGIVANWAYRGLMMLGWVTG